MGVPVGLEGYFVVVGVVVVVVVLIVRFVQEQRRLPTKNPISVPHHSIRKHIKERFEIVVWAVGFFFSVSCPRWGEELKRHKLSGTLRA